MDFKKLDPSHLEQVLGILEKHSKKSPRDSHRFGLTLSNSQVQKTLEKDICLGLFDSEKLLSLITGRKIGPTFEIDLTVTDVSNLKKGYMINLFESALSYLKSSGIVQVWLEVNEENLSAINFYKKVGFKTNSIRPKYYPDGKGAILMTLSL